MIVGMIFQVSTYFKKDQITYYKYVQFNLFLLYLNIYQKEGDFFLKKLSIKEK